MSNSSLTDEGGRRRETGEWLEGRLWRRQGRARVGELRLQDCRVESRTRVELGRKSSQLLHGFPVFYRDTVVLIFCI